MGAAFEHPMPNPALKRDVPQAARPLARRWAPAITWRVKIKIYGILKVAPSILLLSACVTPMPKTNYPDPETYLFGKNIETVASVYGNPGKSNTLGKTLFISYTAYGKDGGGYSNICFLELQGDSETKIIKKIQLGSNLGIDSKNFPLDVRQDCNRAFYRPVLAK